MTKQPVSLRSYLEELQSSRRHHEAGKVRGILSAVETGHIDQAKRLRNLLVADYEAQGFAGLAKKLLCIPLDTK